MQISTIFLLNLHAIQSALKFYFQSTTYYRIHSPFLFELLENTLEDNRHYYIFDQIEDLRNTLLKDNTTLKIHDLGAGSKTSSINQRTIKSITKSAVSPAYQSQFLFKLAQHMKAKNIIELGTSMGISALYLSGYSDTINLITLEGSENIFKAAQKNIQKLRKSNINTILGNFDMTFPQALEKIKTLDFAYIDGNHAKAPTIRYFEWALPYVHHNSVLVFDDIYWSTEMTEAWMQIKAHPAVKMSLDMYYFGIIFFKEDFKEKQDFKVLKSSYKIWQKYI